MLGDDAADWVNVMTYDLHVRISAMFSDVAHAEYYSKGVWDSPLDYIGSIVLRRFSSNNLSGKEMR